VQIVFIKKENIKKQQISKKTYYKIASVTF